MIPQIRKPIVSAPMGFVSGGALAAAVSRAGGIGFITWSLAKRPELLDLALERKPCAVMLSFGDPRPFAAKIRKSGAKLILQVQNLATARLALEAEPDVLVAEGTEAGGHGGDRSLFALLPAVKDLAGKLPVLAAGGIADRRGFEAATALGAAGVLVGTRFIACDEALAGPRAKQRIVEANGDSTIRTTVFDIVRGYDAGWAGITGRALKNRFTATWHGKEPSLRASLGKEREAYLAAFERQDFDTALIFAGEGVDLIDSVLPAAEIVERIVG